MFAPWEMSKRWQTRGRDPRAQISAFGVSLPAFSKSHLLLQVLQSEPPFWKTDHPALPFPLPNRSPRELIMTSPLPRHFRVSSVATSVLQKTSLGSITCHGWGEEEKK